MVQKIVLGSKAATCQSDPIPTSLVKENIDILVPLITKIVNLSLATGYFPDDWKEAYVLPLLKKVGLELINKNYRPVSNLPFISKVCEKSSNGQFTDHMDVNELTADYQSAYKEGYSTETTLIKLHNDVLRAMDRREVTLMILMDLSAAFDTVDHNILLEVLEKRFGVTGTALKWFDSYLRGRRMRTVVGEAKSEPRKLDVSVPQGSCAGPILYTVYASTIGDLFEKAIHTILGYADDHAMYKSFKPKKEIEQYIKKVTEEKLDEIKDWMLANRLKMNDSKTEVIMFGQNSIKKNSEITSIRVGKEWIELTDQVGYLGALLQSDMSMEKFISAICRKANYNLQNIRAIRKYLDVATCKTLMHALVISHLDYANALLAGLPKNQLNKLQSIQNYAAKVTLGRKKYDSSTQALFDLHWLPIEQRIDYKVLSYVYKSVNDQAPKYLQELLTKRASKYDLRCYKAKELEIPTVKSAGFGDRAFSVNGPKKWNKLPKNIRMAPSFDSFKGLLKTHLFRTAFKKIIEKL